ncbi:NADHX epimerase [Ascoidea rubescens DSM 1968]|uniref:NAD(P)H-hydrate epimerase n=1 Tax=Ascoidea rubescens DSM 1968 TaxID=1344418 RepID=A0A1D2VAN1_9ASCO|nr:YjeF N [Ascoidea rubescens DSM 1968]ODV58669.1 YjeF N [Ascoidea rubescens DSM 1968]
MSFRTISSKNAILLDKELMSTSVGFSLDQLMELAGLSVAESVYKSYPPKTHKKMLIIAGPGNNGGDGLVAARHLKLFGYEPTVYYPKPSSSFKGLETQLHRFGIPIITMNTDKIDPTKQKFIFDENVLRKLLEESDGIVDAIFGFSFRPPLRAPFDQILKMVKQENEQLLKKKLKPIISVDLPTGWDVDKGPLPEYDEWNLFPQVLVSLTAPKPAAVEFVRLAHNSAAKGRIRHFLGGRFVSPAFADRWKIDVGRYVGTEQTVELK